MAGVLDEVLDDDLEDEEDKLTTCWPVSICLVERHDVMAYVPAKTPVEALERARGFGWEREAFGCHYLDDVAEDGGDGEFLCDASVSLDCLSVKAEPESWYEDGNAVLNEADFGVDVDGMLAEGLSDMGMCLMSEGIQDVSFDGTDFLGVRDGVRVVVRPCVGSDGVVGEAFSRDIWLKCCEVAASERRDEVLGHYVTVTGHRADSPVVSTGELVPVAKVRFVS